MRKIWLATVAVLFAIALVACETTPPPPVVGNLSERDIELAITDSMLIVFNAVLPILLLHARVERNLRDENAVWAICDAFPRLESNWIVRHMQTRLFGDHDYARTLFDTEEKQQGLFQVFSDFCNHLDTSCEECYFLAAHR